MTEEQFSALAELMRLRGGPGEDAARLVLVNGLKPTDAARKTGITPQAVNKTLSSCRRGIELARQVCASTMGDT
ncbi:TrfB-related DNA-binding protein [Pseudomonas aeruginosa]